MLPRSSLSHKQSARIKKDELYRFYSCYRILLEHYNFVLYSVYTHPGFNRLSLSIKQNTENTPLIDPRPNPQPQSLCKAKSHLSNIAKYFLRLTYADRTRNGRCQMQISHKRKLRHRSLGLGRARLSDPGLSNIQEV